MKTRLTAGVFAMICAGAAFAQSHSVANSTNPPDNAAQSKAAVEATPGRNATAHQNTDAQGDKNAGQAGKSKHVKVKKTASAKGAKTSAGTGAESAMETQPSETSSSTVEKKAFDVSPGHSGK